MAKYDFPRVRSNDTFTGVEFTLLVNGVALDLNGNTSIRMDLRETPESTTYIKRFSTPSGGMSISSPTTAGKFTLNGQIIDILPGNWYYDIEITLDNGEIHTWIWGNWRVDRDITHD